MKIILSYEKQLTFSEEIEVDEHEYLHLKDLQESRPHSFLREVVSRVSTDDIYEAMDGYPDMEVSE